MQTQSQPVAPPLAKSCRRQTRPILTTVLTVGTLLSAARAGEPVPASTSSRNDGIAAQNAKPVSEQTSPPQAEPARKEKANPADPAPLPAGEQTSPSDPLFVPELPRLPEPLSEPERSGRRDRRVALRDEAQEEEGALDPASEAEAKPGTFVVPGFYGGGPSQYTAGKGRLAVPGFRTSFSMGVGYDDNIRSATSAAGAEKVASAFTSARLSTSYQTAGLMQLFVFDGSAGTDIYWDQQDPDYDLSLGMSYVRRFVSPARVTGNAALSYRTQPDYRQVNLVRGAAEDDGDEGASGVLSASAKLDLSYAWTAQFSTLSSISADTILYGGDRSSADSIDITLGNEFRYRVDRYTWIGEARYQFNARPNDEDQESDTLFLLGGVEWRLGPWIQFSGRFGGTVRSYQDGGSVASPHGEIAIGFQPNIQNSFSLNARYGLERTALEGGDSKTFRLGASYTRVFSSRMSGTIAASYLHSEQSIETGGGSDTDAGSGGGERIFDVTASLNYQLTRHLSLSASLTCTRGDAAEGAADPDRNRFVLNGNYQF
jgi:hypothetical protein